MLNHVILYVSDIVKSKEFFIQALAPLGYKIFLDKETSVGFGDGREGNSDLVNIRNFSIIAQQDHEPWYH